MKRMPRDETLHKLRHHRKAGPHNAPKRAWWDPEERPRTSWWDEVKRILQELREEREKENPTDGA